MISDVFFQPPLKTDIFFQNLTLDSSKQELDPTDWIRTV